VASRLQIGVNRSSSQRFCRHAGTQSMGSRHSLRSCRAPEAPKTGGFNERTTPYPMQGVPCPEGGTTSYCNWVYAMEAVECTATVFWTPCRAVRILHAAPAFRCDELQTIRCQLNPGLTVLYFQGILPDLVMPGPHVPSRLLNPQLLLLLFSEGDCDKI